MVKPVDILTCLSCSIVQLTENSIDGRLYESGDLGLNYSIKEKYSADMWSNGK